LSRNKPHRSFGKHSTRRGKISIDYFSSYRKCPPAILMPRGWRGSPHGRRRSASPRSSITLHSPNTIQLSSTTLGSMADKEPQDARHIVQRRVVRIIFVSLLLDLLAFTMPLPLFPRLIASFVEAERTQGVGRNQFFFQVIESN